MLCQKRDGKNAKFIKVYVENDKNIENTTFIDMGIEWIMIYD